MAERLGLGIIPGVGWRAEDIQAIAREAEDAGFDRIFAAEVNNDVMATTQLIAAASRRATVGTWIANIDLRTAGPVSGTARGVSRGRHRPAHSHASVDVDGARALIKAFRR